MGSNADHMLLLSPELRRRVEGKVEDCIEIAENYWEQKFKMPEIRYDVKNSYGGIAHPSFNLIRFNLILLVEFTDQFLEDTVPHEFAHLVVPQVFKAPEGKRLMPHGREWIEVMRILGAPAKLTHTYTRR